MYVTNQGHTSVHLSRYVQLSILILQSSRCFRRSVSVVTHIRAMVSIVMDQQGEPAPVATALKATAAASQRLAAEVSGARAITAQTRSSRGGAQEGCTVAGVAAGSRWRGPGRGARARPAPARSQKIMPLLRLTMPSAQGTHAHALRMPEDAWVVGVPVWCSVPRVQHGAPALSMVTRTSCGIVPAAVTQHASTCVSCNDFEPRFECCCLGSKQHRCIHPPLCND